MTSSTCCLVETWSKQVQGVGETAEAQHRKALVGIVPIS